MKIAILDDDEKCAETIKQILIQTCDCISVDCFTHLSNFTANVYDALFLDIELDGMDKNGFEVANMVKKECNIPIVFITSHSEYALDGYQYKPFDFVWKANIQERIPLIGRELEAEYKKKNEKLELRDSDNCVTSIMIVDIMYFYNEGNYCVIKADKDYKLRSSTKQLLFQIEAYGVRKFISPLTGYVANVDYIERIEKTNLTILMKDGKKLPIGLKNITKIMSSIRALGE